MKNEFVAIDVETANADCSSICQIGLAHYKNGELVSEFASLINPEDYFDGLNVGIHGIDEDKVKNSPTLIQIYKDILAFFNVQIVVSHTHFDRVAITRAFKKYNLSLPEISWLDSARVARRTWEQFSQRGYGLSSICSFLKYNFNHHNALEDAKAAAYILHQAIEIKKISIEEWIEKQKKPTLKNYIESLEVNRGLRG
jgi:DNA polymerase-3 subunit epsilon